MIILAGSAISSALALAGVVIGVWLGGRSQDVRWLKDAQLKSFIQLMDQYELCYQGLEKLHDGQMSWAPWNQALSAVAFVGDVDVVSAAYALDEQFWIIGRQYSKDPASLRSTWAQTRVPLEEARETFI